MARLLWLLALLAPAPALDYQIELTSPAKLFDGKYSWAHPRAGTIPPRSRGNDTDTPVVVMTLQRIQLSGSDLFEGLNEMRTDDRGKTWQGPTPVAGFERRAWKESREITVCDFTPRWHAASGTLLGTGQTVIYEKGKVLEVRPRETAYSAYDAGERTWSPWRTLRMPDDPKFANAGAGSVQRLDLP